jgi:hypothetical protein
MDQKPIVLYLRMKRMGLDAIHNELVSTLGKDAVTYSTVTNMFAALSFPAERKEGNHPSRSSRCGTQSC